MLDSAHYFARIDKIGGARFAAAAVVIYLGLAAFAYWPAWPGDPHLIVGCACGDQVQQSWFLGWLTFAITHSHNPFFTNWIDFPAGVNLAVNTEMPLLGLATAPLSLTAGAVSSYGLLLFLAYPLSATSAFFVIRRWTSSNLAASSGGLLYGFSPYMVGQGHAHLNLVFVPLPPLIFMALHEIFIQQHSRPIRWGIALGFLVAAQYLISAEALGTTAILAICALVIVVIARRKEVVRTRVIHALRALVPALVISGGILAYPVYFLVAGPRRWNGPAFPIDNVYRADLLGMVVPSSAQAITFSAATHLGNRFADGLIENGSYIGIPLLLLTCICVIRYRRDRWIQLTTALAAVALVLSLGPSLVIAGHLTGFPMPFAPLGRIPFIDNVLPIRFSLYVDLFVAMTLSRAFDVARESPRRERTNGITSPVVAILMVASIIALVPSWPDAMALTRAQIPPFFASTGADRIPAGAVVLAFPFPQYPSDEAMLWQISDRWRWKLIGGYALIPLHGRATESQPRLSPFAVQRFLSYWDDSSSITNPLAPKPPPPDARLVSQLRIYAQRNGVTFVIFEPFGGDPTIVKSVLERAFGPGRKHGRAEVWNLSSGELAAP